LASRRRGVKGTVAAGGSGNFSPRTGAGYVAYKKPDYAHALLRSDTDLLMLLFQTYGGWCGAALPTDAGQGAEQANETAVRERSDTELVDVDVARAAGTAPVGGGAHTIASAWEIATEI